MTTDTTAPPLPAPRPGAVNAAAGDDEQVRTWWFTFGGGHEHPDTGQSLAGAYITITGTFETARDRMFAMFGARWSNQYASAEDAGVGEHSTWQAPVPASLNEDEKQFRIIAAYLLTDMAGEITSDNFAAGGGPTAVRLLTRYAGEVTQLRNALVFHRPDRYGADNDRGEQLDDTTAVIAAALECIADAARYRAEAKAARVVADINAVAAGGEVRPRVRGIGEVSYSDLLTRVLAAEKAYDEQRAAVVKLAGQRSRLVDLAQQLLTAATDVT